MSLETGRDRCAVLAASVSDRFCRSALDLKSPGTHSKIVLFCPTVPLRQQIATPE
jgi:hypothetical protein